MKFWQMLSAAVLAVILVGCGTKANTDGEVVAEEELVVTGSVFYRDRSALPPQAMVSVVLADASEVGAPAKILSQVLFPAAGKQVPINFSLPYSKKQAENAKRIIASARIEVDGRVIYNTNRVFEVITNDKTGDVNIMVDRTAAAQAAQE